MKILFFWKNLKLYWVEIKTLPVIMAKMTIKASLGLVKSSLCAMTDCSSSKMQQKLRICSKDFAIRQMIITTHFLSTLMLSSTSYK